MLMYYVSVRPAQTRELCIGGIHIEGLGIHYNC